MRQRDIGTFPCSVARSAEIFADPWTLLVLRDAFYGVKRFEDWQRDLGIARNLLADRLRLLVHAELFTKVAYSERPVRFEYRLTAKGRDAFTVVAAMMAWGDKWLATPAGPPIELIDTMTGAVIAPQVVDGTTGQPLDLRRMGARRGPGFPENGGPEAAEPGLLPNESR